MVWINCYKRVNPGSPFGGVGQSGYGREMGFEAMHEYTQAKACGSTSTRRFRLGTRGRHERCFWVEFTTGAAAPMRTQ